MSGSAIRSGRPADHGAPDTRLNHSNRGFPQRAVRDDYGKCFSQHLSFGATIKAPQGCDLSAAASADWRAATPSRFSISLPECDKSWGRRGEAPDEVSPAALLRA